MEDELTIFRELQSGTTLHDGKYIIEKALGQGGFGITYYAYHTKLKEYVAIKEFFINGYCVRNTQNRTVILQGMEKDMFEKYREKFLEEARMLHKLNHTGIVKVMDFFDENGTSYFVMPFIQGKPLQKIVEEHGKLSFEMAVNYVAQVCEALDYLHKRKPSILHRDVKPDNIIITPDNRAILIDFGSAREFIQDQIPNHTITVTHGYAPPEQYNSQSPKGAYTDIYAVGAVLYFIITGKTPLYAPSRLQEKLPDPKKFVPKLSDAANRTIMKAMAIQSEERYQNVDELMREFTGGKKSKKWIIWLVIVALLTVGCWVLWYYLKAIEEEFIIEDPLETEYIITNSIPAHEQPIATVQPQTQTESVPTSASTPTPTQTVPPSNPSPAPTTPTLTAEIERLTNGNVRDLKIREQGNFYYLRPTDGEFDGTVWYRVDRRGGIPSKVETAPAELEVTYSGQMRNGLMYNGEYEYEDGERITIRNGE